MESKKILRFFGTLSDETRLKIVMSLTKSSKNVGEIHDYVGKDKITLSGISHQLKQLEDIDIVVFEKKGREKFFSLSGDFCWCILRDAIDHFNGKKHNCKECCKIKEDMGG
ncbi:MAG: ArsR family transcriptional regulator [Nanoarchaeota archaeon]|nr:ArsR family transcriptional regulator [Nanoarchaeota archaeon]